MIKNKSGMSTFFLFFFIFAAFFFAFFLGLGLWMFSLVNSALDQDVMVGQVNLQTINNQTFGAIYDGFLNSADTIGILVLLMMSFLMIVNAYFLSSDNPKLFLVADILILVFVFILAVYISQVYSIFINSSSLISEVFIDDIPKPSTFILNLPSIVGTLGALIMIASYSGLRKRREKVNVLDF